MTPDVASVIDHAMQSIERSALPQELQDRIEKHKENLSDLAASLLAVGHDADQIQITISKVLDSFKEELSRALIALRENNDAI